MLSTRLHQSSELALRIMLWPLVRPHKPPEIESAGSMNSISQLQCPKMTFDLCLMGEGSSLHPSQAGDVRRARGLDHPWGHHR
jgi:hypothetical protein